ncbi:hypothetical protein GRI40_06105 [Altererythrobacter aerius]|uniref:Uncharacterized protein n=1 Tax=Tsuneonella aeria TaxID=1837929 RepID=A0A6I4TC16_9SPHN|nr:hypothetical protein [Tsuneonella aeria]
MDVRLPTDSRGSTHHASSPLKGNDHEADDFLVDVGSGDGGRMRSGAE